MTTTTRPKTAAKTDEGRRAPRKATRTLGYIIADSLPEVVECTVLDLSASGAKLKLANATRKAFTTVVELPDEFRIELPRDRLVVDCKIAWKKDGMAGVSFKSAFRPLTSSRR